MDIAELLLVIGGENAGGMRALGETQAGLASLHGQADRTSGGLANLAGTVSKVGAAVAAAGAVIGVASIKMAADFEASTTRLQTQAHMSAQTVDEVRVGLLKMAAEVGKSPTELSEGFYHVASALTQLPPNLRNVNSELDIYKNAVELSKIGNAGLERSTQAVIGVLAAFGKEGMTAAEAAAELNAIVGAGDMKMEQLTAAMATGILPAAATFGLKLKDVGAALATLTDNVTPADEAATRLRMTFSLLGAPSHQAQKAMEAIGINATQLGYDMRQPNGLLVALTDLRGHLSHIDVSGIKGGLDTAKTDLEHFGFTTDQVDKMIGKLGPDATEQAVILSKAFGGGRTSAAIMTLLTEFDSFKEKYGAISDGARKFQDDWAATQKTFAMQFDRLKASAEVLAITLGNRILPVITPIVKAIADAAMSTNGWVKALVDFAIGVGAVLVGLSALAAILPFLIGGFELLLGPVGLAIGLLVGAAYLIKANWGTIAPFFEDIANRIRAAFDGVLSAWDRLMKGGSGAQALFQGLTGIKPTAGGAGPQESGRTQRMNNAPSGGQLDFQESAAALRGNVGVGSPIGDTFPGRQAPRPGSAAEAELFTQRALRAAPSETVYTAAQQRTIGSSGGAGGTPQRMGGVAALPRGLATSETGTPGVATPGGLGPASLSGPAQIANTLGPLIDHAIDLFHRLSLAWNEVVRGFQNGASFTTVLIGVLMSLGVGGDKAVGIAHALSDIWNRIASFVGPLLRNLLEQGIKPALADIQKNLGPLGREFSEAFVAWAPILRAIGVVLAFLIGVLFKSFIETLTVTLPIAVHIVIDILHVLALLFKTVADIIKGDWGALGWDLIHIGQFFIGEIVNLFMWLWHMLVGGSIVPDLVNGIIGWFKGLSTQVFAIVDGWVNSLIARFGELKDGLLNMAKQIASGLIDFFGGGLNSVLALFRGFLDALSKIPGIGALVPDANKVLGNIDLGALKKTIGLATGGMITNGPYVVGEGDPAHPEYVIPTDPRYRDRAQSLLQRAVMAVGLAEGGTIPTSGSDGECVEFAEQYLGVHWPVGAAKELVRYMNSDTAKPGEAAVFTAGPYGHVAIVTGTESGGGFPVVDSNWVGHHQIGTHVMNRGQYGFAGFIDLGKPLGTLVGGGGGSGFNPLALVDDALKKAQGDLNSVPEWIRGLASSGLTKIAQSAKDKVLSSFAGALTGTGTVSGNVTDWIHQAEKLAGVGDDWTSGLQELVSKESSGDPKAHNDSGASGIAQMKPGTFSSHWLAGHHDIWNPVDNLASAIRYIQATYGTPGHIPNLFGRNYVGYDAGGTLMPGLTMALNNTGRPETVLPPGAGLSGAGAAALGIKLDRTNDLLYQILTDSPVANGFTAGLRAG